MQGSSKSGRCQLLNVSIHGLGTRLEMNRLAVTLGLLALSLLYFSEVLTGKYIFIERDLATFFYPFRFIWVETVRQGHFPFWNPFIKCGVPLFATIQPGVLYPLSLLYLFLPLDLAFNWTIILHFFLAAAFTYALMRELGASIQGALCASLAFLFGGYLIAVHNVLNTLISVTWFPLVILCGCLMVKSGKIRWAVAGGGSLCCMLLGGGVETVLFALASLLVLCFYPHLLLIGDSDNFPRLKRRLGLLGLTVVIFLGLSMVQLLPFLELYRFSHRSGGVPLKEATSWSLDPRDLIYLLLPDFYGERISADRYWKYQNYLKSIYVGPIIFFLAGYYFIRKGRRGLALLGTMVIALIFALGEYTPVYSFFYRYFPLFDTLRYPVKFIFLFIFCLCVAAGLGLDFMAQRFSERKQPPIWLQVVLVTAVLSLAGLLVVNQSYPGQVLSLAQRWWGSFIDFDFLPTVLHNINRLLLVTILGLMCIFFGLRRRLVRSGAPLLLTLLVLELFLGNRGYARKISAETFHDETEIIAAMKADKSSFRFHVLPEVHKITVLAQSREEIYHIRKEFLEDDLMMEHHLFDIDGYNVPLQRRYERLMSLIRNQPLKPPVPNLLNLLNVKYVLSANSIDLPGYAPVKDGLMSTKLYENRNYLPRAFLVKEFRVLNHQKDFGEAFYDPSFDPSQTVLLESVPARLLELRKKPSIPDLKEEVRVLSYENNRIVLEVKTPEAGLLFMSETFYPGWKAYVDHRQEQILQANYVFRAVPIGSGSHRVEMVFQSFSFNLGLTVSLVTILILVTAGAISTRRKKLK